MQENTGLSRRAFLKAAAAGTLGVAGAGALAACSPSVGGGATEGDSESTSTSASSSTVPTGYQCTEDWLGEAPQIDPADISETIETDVLVLGGGNAGIQAALAAAEGGAKVDVVEVMSEDVRKVKGEDVGHINSQFLISRGFGPYDVGEVVHEFSIRTGGRINPEIVRKYLANSGEAFDHTAELVTWPDERIKVVQSADPTISPLDDSQMCVQVAGIAADGPVTYPMVRGGYKYWAAVAQFMGTTVHEPSPGVALFSRLDEFQQFAILKGQDLGATWHYGESAIVLTQDSSGAVTGAITEKNDGSYAEYKTSKGVILCTGDFSGNPQMVWALCTEVSEWDARAGQTADDVMGMMGCTGAGQKMGCWAGGSIEPAPRGVGSFGSGGGGPWGPSPYLWLNADGKRYMNEGAALLALPQTLRQPAGIVCTVTDKKWYDTMKNCGLDHGSPNYGRPVYFEELVEDMNNVPVGDPAGGGCRTCCVAERMAETVFAAETLEELAGFLGYTGETVATFLKSIEDYNKLCYAGSDTQYGKDAIFMLPIDEPPFYGYASSNTRTTGAGVATLSGLVTDNDLQVVDQDNKPIPGLWAAGNCLGGRFGTGYVTPFAGTSIGMAFTHGRVAGKIATGQEVL
jgi:hypothetical protein